RRHNFRISLNYQKSAKFQAVASWVYMSGEAFTLPDQIYPDFDRNLNINPGTDVHSYDYTYSLTKWNNYRLPAIHRLDLACHFFKQIKPMLSRTWSLGISTAYGRPNVWFAELENDPNTNKFKLKGISYTRFLPFINYKINF